MNRFLLLFTALIASEFLFAQNDLKFDEPKTAREDGWVGNFKPTNFSYFEDAEYVIAPRMFNPDIFGEIDSIRFGFHQYNDYNTTSFTLKIYENVNLQPYDDDLFLYSSCGDLVYTQEITVEDLSTGWKYIALDTPYQIKDGDFWVGIQMHGEGTIVTGGMSTAMEGQYYYTEMYSYNWYWKVPIFWVNYQDVLYSCALSIHVRENQSVGEFAENAVTVFPNPTYGILNIEGENIQKVSVFDMTGREVMTVNEDADVINMTGMQAGLYMVRIYTENGVSVKCITVL